ncbi:MAG TPA: DMT family transporter [Candidatus Bathyarchaeia archaeon]|nr:DMT family transporter [Candidatus Bathyarchaeia archaeon]
MTNTILAIFMGIFAYSSLNIGLVLQKKGASSLPKIEEVKFWQNFKNFFTNKIWLLGFLLTVLAFGFLVVAMNQGSLSIVAPMQAIGLIVLVIFSYFYLKERIQIPELIAIGLIVIGVIILGITNPDVDFTYTLEEVNESFLQIRSLIFIGLLTVIVIILSAFSFPKKFQFTSAIFAFGGGIFSGLGDTFTKAFMSGLDFSNFNTSFVFVLSKWYWWLYVLLMSGYNIIAGIFPQIAFQRGKAVIVTPIFSVMSLTTPVFCGIIVFSEWSGLAVSVLIMKIVSIVLVVGGVIILSYLNAKSTNQNIKEDTSELSNTIEAEI